MPCIKPKIGKCIDCDSDTSNKTLIAGRCQHHYWKHRNKVKSDTRKEKEPEVEADKFAQKKALDLWYKNQIDQMPYHCENCNDRLFLFAPWAAKAFIAHILPKRHFKSVMINPSNRLFLCVQCHANYDNWSADKIKQMPSFRLAVERLLSFHYEIDFDELRYLPDCFTTILSEEINKK